MTNYVSNARELVEEFTGIKTDLAVGYVDVTADAVEVTLFYRVDQVNPKYRIDIEYSKTNFGHVKATEPVQYES
jgi:hypothetical protein